ncbi:MAG: phosphatidylinositol-3-phosphatase [Nocardioidaceae bacterium]|nr:phosphatidylinositol-3-phosphatase [Nocardioidaceae bacterium]
MPASGAVDTVACMRVTGVASVLAALALLAGCSSSGDQKAAPADRHTGASSSASARASTSTVQPTKVLVVIEENHSYAQMRKGMPFLAGVSDKYGYATNWKAIAHPSEPNYLAIAGGSTFGISDDKAPAAHFGDIGSAKSVFDEALAAGKTAGTYAESMPQSCHVYDYPDRSVGTPVYAVRHNPWVYFKSGRKDCQRFDLPLSAFTEDAADNVLPNVGFLVPNLDHDAHNGSLAAADAWLDRQLTPVLGSDDFTSGRLVVVVTADEDDKHSGNTVLTSVLTPALTGKVVDTPLTHYSLNRYIAEVLGVTPLGEAAGAPDLRTAFGL